MTRNIDELSNLTTQKAEPPKEYFGKMDLNEEQVEKRLQYTKKANELFDVILILLLTMNERGETNFFYAKSLLESWILSLVAEFTTPDDYLMDYATDTAYNFVDTTNKHIDEPWYTSSDRALYNAENGANDVLNYTEYKEAIEAGKTEKRWITEKDNRVRKSHKAVTQKPIPILEYFRVGMAQMRFPKDYELAAAFPEELINCRCTIEYLPKDSEDDIIRNKMVAGKYPVSNEQIDDILNNELKEFEMPVKPTYNPRIRSQGRVRATETGWGTVTINSIDIGKQVKDTRECLIDSILHEYLESQILLNKNFNQFYADLYSEGDEAIHKYINDYIKDFFNQKGLNYGLV